jgi:DNA-binding beta-propeller fold protein YncE
MLKKLIIKGLILLLVIGVLAGISWTINRKIIKEKDIKEIKEIHGKPILLWEKSLETDFQVSDITSISSLTLIPDKTAPIITVTTRGKVFSLDSSGGLKIIEQLEKNQLAFISDNGEYIGIATYGNGDFTIKRFVLKNRKGEILWEKVNTEDYAVAEITGDGKLVIGVSCISGPPIGIDKTVMYSFYGAFGELIGKIEIYQPRSTTLSPDGSVFLCNSYKEGISAFDRNVNLIWKIEKSFRMFAVSNKAEYLVACDSNSINLYKHGVHSKTINVDYRPRNVAISPDGSYFVVSSNNTLHLFDTDKAKVIWEYVLSDPQLSFNSVSISKQGRVIGAGMQRDAGPNVPSEKRYTQGHVYLFDNMGKKIFEKELHYNLSNAWIPLVKVNPEGNFMAVQTREKLYFFELRK